MSRFRTFAAIVLAASICVPAGAYAASDKATGLAVNPSQKFHVEKTTRRGQDVLFRITAKDGKPVAANRDGSLCGVAFKSAPQNAKLSRRQINELTLTKGRQDQVKRILGRVFEITAMRVIDHQGYKALEVQATPRTGPDAASVRMFLVMIETVKGRTSLSCATRASAVPAALKDFRAIRATINAPR